MVAALAAGGCGDDGESSPPPDFAPSEPVSEAKQQFIERADRICKIVQAAGQRLPEDPRSAREWFVTGRGTARVYRTGIRSVLVLELPPPGPDFRGARAFKRAVRDILAGVRDVERETRALGDAIEDRDAERAARRVAGLEAALKRTNRLDMRSTRIAEAYGMDACGDDGAGAQAPDIPLGPEV